jgi:steroid 5-alpha reductase family enzyme
LSFDALSWTPLAWIGGAMFLLWLLSLVLRDASIVDIFWGIGFVLVAWVSSASNEEATTRETLVRALVTIWGLRLAVHLFARNAGKGEDPRYQAMRRHWGERFPLVSLATVFGLQGLLLFVVSLPLQVAINSPLPDAVRWTDIIGAAIWLIGFGFETVGDAQLTAFKSEPGNAGAVMDHGLWRYTRHPNYFGDALLWWGVGLIALSVPDHQWVLVGPVVMTVLLLRVSGVPLLERRIKMTRPDYSIYASRTSAFIPMLPREMGHSPHDHRDTATYDLPAQKPSKSRRK